MRERDREKIRRERIIERKNQRKKERAMERKTRNRKTKSQPIVTKKKDLESVAWPQSKCIRIRPLSLILSTPYRFLY